MADGSAAEAAYQAAVEVINSIRRLGGGVLVLSDEHYGALDRIPPEIAGISFLEYAIFDGTAISDISPLAALKKMGRLHLNNTLVSDLSPLASMKELAWLDLNDTKVNDLSPIVHLVRLNCLFLNRTLVKDLEPLAAQPRLSLLSLSQTTVSDLSPLRGMTEMQGLYLDRTAVKDLSPLRNMTVLETLTLDHSDVGDLRPISNLQFPMQQGGRGLAFSDTPATRRDPELHRLSQIKDDEQRTRETLAYLKTLPPWPEPLPWNETPANPPPLEQDPALPLIWGEKGFAFLARSIDSDPVTEAALDDLRTLLEDLRRKGNRHDDLYRLAGEMQERSSGPIADLHMVKLHLSYQKLRRLYQSRGSRVEAFDDETVGVLGSVLEILPGVTLADPGVEKLIQRQEAERLAGTNPEKVAAEAGMLMAVQSDDAPFADEVKDTAKAILEQGHDDRLTATRGILSRNSLIAVLKFFRNDPIGAGITGSLITTFALSYSPALLALAGTMGSDVLFWAQTVLSNFNAEYQLATGIAREALSSGTVALPRKRRGGA